LPSKIVESIKYLTVKFKIMKEELLEYGLSEKEAELYLAALKFGDATANRLSEATKLTRSTIYDIVESLKKKGLMSSYKKDTKYFFSASNPEALITILKNKEQLIKQILPNLKKLGTLQPERPIITVYHGKTGLKTAANEMLEEKEILAYGGGINAEEVFGSYTANFAQKRAEKKIQIKAIGGKSIPKHMKERKIKQYTSVRSLKIFENHNTTYFLYGTTVLILTYAQEFIATKIESKTFSESQRQIFEYFWKQANS